MVCEALSENSVVGPRASGLSSGKDGETGDIGCIVDAAGRRPGAKQAARSQIECSGTALTTADARSVCVSARWHSPFKSRKSHPFDISHLSRISIFALRASSRPGFAHPVNIPQSSIAVPKQPWSAHKRGMKYHSDHREDSYPGTPRLALHIM